MSVLYGDNERQAFCAPGSGNVSPSICWFLMLQAPDQESAVSTRLEVGSFPNYSEFVLVGDRHEAPARIRLLLAGKKVDSFERAVDAVYSAGGQATFPPSDSDQGRLI